MTTVTRQENPLIVPSRSTSTTLIEAGVKHLISNFGPVRPLVIRFTPSFTKTSATNNFYTDRSGTYEVQGARSVEELDCINITCATEDSISARIQNRNGDLDDWEAPVKGEGPHVGVCDLKFAFDKDFLTADENHEKTRDGDTDDTRRLVKLTLEHAMELLRAKGYTGVVTAVTLVEPLVWPATGQAFWTFHVVADWGMTVIGVGAADGRFRIDGEIDEEGSAGGDESVTEAVGTKEESIENWEPDQELAKAWGWEARKAT